MCDSTCDGDLESDMVLIGDTGTDLMARTDYDDGYTVSFKVKCKSGLVDVISSQINVT